MFDSLFVANRGEIARRIIQTTRAMGVHTTTPYSDVDANLPHAVEADRAIPIGDPAPRNSYANIDTMVTAALRSGAQAVHPGYGLLSENAEFAQRIIDAGLTWIGPPPETIAHLGNKINARTTMATAHVPISPGSDQPLRDVHRARAAACATGYPVMLKPAAGGGGMGMKIATDEQTLVDSFTTVTNFADRTFGDPTVLIERYHPEARHIEVQVVGLNSGQIITLGSRDCSVQRRHQKLVEETPPPNLSQHLQHQLETTAARAAETVNYRNVGTVEFLVSHDDFHFLEMNTRLQVEHPITEAIFDTDLVKEQLHLAAREPTTIDTPSPHPHGHAVEMRINAEDPNRFLPKPGTIHHWHQPTGPGVRIDAGYTTGCTITPHYDPLIAKLITHADTRQAALARAATAITQFQITGPQTNLDFFTKLLNNDAFKTGTYNTSLINTLP